MVIFTSLLLLLSSFAASYQFSPADRTVVPVAITRTKGNVALGSDVASYYVLTGPNASITYDFGQMTAGLPTLDFGDSQCENCTVSDLPGFTCSAGCNGLGVAYTESALFIGAASDNTVLYSHPDGTLFVPVTTGLYTLPPAYARGSFRYLTLSIPASASASQSIKVRLTQVAFGAQPSLTDPRGTSAYFSSSDDVLNHVWAAAAYTMQLCTVAANTSVQHIYAVLPVGWTQDAIVSNLTGQDEFLADGAKRDKNPWAGDLGVALRSAVALYGGDLTPVKNSLYGMIVLQDTTTGYFPYCGSPLGSVFSFVGPLYGSDTYHLWTIAAFAEYILASQDTAFGTQYWSAFERGLQVSLAKIDNTTGLFNGSGTEDWGRIGVGGESTSSNALLYYALNIMTRAASFLSKTSDGWTTSADAFSASVNQHLFDDAAGLFWDNTTSAGHAIYPQDGNVLAVHFGLVDASTGRSIMRKLAERHTMYGAPAPELPGAISPFISSLELFANLDAEPSSAERALSLVRQQWGFMLNNFSNSTLIEGYGSDGSLTYPFYPDGSNFISHAHAWSTGPLYLLSSRIAGLRASVFDVPEEDGDWVFQPAVHGTDLTNVNAGFARPAGMFEATWTMSEDSWDAEIEVPAASSGTLYIPVFGGCSTTYLDGKELQEDDTDDETGFLRLTGVAGGKHTLTVVF